MLISQSDLLFKSRMPDAQDSSHLVASRWGWVQSGWLAHLAAAVSLSSQSGSAPKVCLPAWVQRGCLYDVSTREAHDDKLV